MTPMDGKPYYVLTEKGLDKVEAGLPEKTTDYYSVLGAIADLEEAHGGSKALCETDIRKVLGDSRKPIYFTLKSLVKNGLVEVVKYGDERFTW